jgi:hypothetical protein
MATEEDIHGIRKLIHPLEESGVLVRRTDKEVCQNFDLFIECLSVKPIGLFLLLFSFFFVLSSTKNVCPVSHFSSAS